MDHLRLLVDRIMGRETILDLRLLGVPVRLVVKARREVRRAHSISKEAGLVERMIEFLTDGDIVYDVGANIGVIGILLASCDKGRRSRVHCFEPEPSNFEQLGRNIVENELAGRVSAHRLALTDTPGELELFVRGGPGEGRHSTVESEGSTGSVRVAADTGDAFAASTGEAPDLIKIDVEGAEGRVLAGMSELIAAHRPREIFMEIHRKGEGDRMPDGTGIGPWLAGCGYGLTWELDRGGSRHCHYR